MIINLIYAYRFLRKKYLFVFRLVLFEKVCGLFFQGTQSANPHNDYCQHYVDTGERPQNFIRDVGKK